MTTAELVCVECGGKGPVTPGIKALGFDNSSNSVSPCEAYQLLLNACESDIIMYIHDDVTIHDTDWISRIMTVFDDNPQCVAVGLGGATGLGHPDLYKRPYNIWNMARNGYASNQDDAEVHGERFTGSRKVAVLDAFFLAIRTDFLRSVGGWPVGHLTFHCLDLWMACMAARNKKETWMVGVSCVHHGGGTSTKESYQKAKWLQGGDTIHDHQDPHVWLAKEFRDVLPIRIL